MVLGKSADAFNHSLQLTTLQKVTDGRVSEELSEQHNLTKSRVKLLLTNKVEAIILHHNNVFMNPHSKRNLIKCKCG